MLERHALRALLAMVATIALVASAAAQVQVLSVSPASNRTDADPSAPIVIEFDRPMDPITVNDDSVWAFGRWSGMPSASLTLSPDGRTVTLTPSAPFSSGEQVMVILSHDLRGTDGVFLRSAGYSWLYWTATLSSSGTYTELMDFSTRTNPGDPTRSYGGVGSDLDNDGFLDLGIINEITGDLRVYLNSGDGSGLYSDMIEPPTMIGFEASPNEPADFDRDGNVDLCVSNAITNTISVLIGNGDGTFLPQQTIDVGPTPRGVTVLDVDGDGDLDIANANFGAGGVSVALNDGTGLFGAPVYYATGGIGDWPVSAGDFDEDGVLDLAVGMNLSEEIVIMRGNGDGTFTPIEAQGGVGGCWMLAAGDLNGDGHIDVTSANSFSNSGAVTFGDGTGALGTPTVYSTASFPIASDVGDLDGDGDLDWVISHFGEDFHFLVNDGSGGFGLAMTFPAPSAASCAILLDIDNDRDLDLALVDELADRVIIQRQDGTPGAPVGPQFVRGNCNQDANVDIGDVIFALGALFTGGDPGSCDDACDMNDDGSRDIGDPIALLDSLFGGGGPLPAPAGACGEDPSTDSLGCVDFSGCP